MKPVTVNLDTMLANTAVVMLLSNLYETGWAPREDQITAAVETLPKRSRKNGRAFIEKVIQLKTSPKAYRAHKQKVKMELSANRDADKAYRVKLFRQANHKHAEELEAVKVEPKSKRYLKK